MRDHFSLPVSLPYPAPSPIQETAEQGAGVKQTHLEGSVIPRKAGGRWDYTPSQSRASKDVSEKVED